MVTTKSAATGIETKSKPVEVAGSVRYDLGERVTIKHGGATAISIINKPIAAEDAFLYRPDANAPGSEKYPFRAVRLENSSGFTLEAGPIAVFARGTFVGDSLLGALGLDETAWIPYAARFVDDGHAGDDERREEREDRRDPQGARVRRERGRADDEVRGHRRAAAAEAAVRAAREVGRVRGGRERAAPPGAIDQGDAWLVPLPIVAGATSELVVEEKEPRRRSLTLVDAHAQELGAYVEATGNLPPAVADTLKQAIALRAEVAGLGDRSGDAARDRYTESRRAARAHEIRSSITALASVKNADDLRKKLVIALATATTDADALTKQLAAKTEALTAARSRLADAIRDLVLEEPKH